MRMEHIATSEPDHKSGNHLHETSRFASLLADPPPVDIALTLVDAADFVTVLSAHVGCNLTKTIYRDADGSLALRAYDNAYMFKADAHGFDTLEELMWVLRGLEPNQCIVQGKVLDGVDPTNIRRLLKPHKDGSPPTITTAAHEWLPIDADGIEAKDEAGEFDPVAEPLRAVACVIAKLPPEFKDAGCIWQFTSSAGIKDGIRMRLYFGLSRPLTCAEVGVWLKGCPIDKSIYSPNHVIYAAAPIISEGAVDPVGGKVRRGPHLIHGDAVAPPEVIAVKPETAPRKAPEGVEWDTPYAIVKARRYLAGIDITEGLFKPACRLLDWGISPDRAIELFEEVGADYEWAAEKVQHALAHRQNDLGCDIPVDPVEKWSAFAKNTQGAAANEEETSGAVNEDDSEVLPAGLVHGSDDELAAIFELQQDGNLLYVPAWAKWLEYRGGRWSDISIWTVWNRMRPLARELAATLDKENEKRTMTGKSRVVNAESLCRGAMESAPGDWDADPYHLNTPGGIVDLRTGMMQPAGRADRCLKSTTVAPGGDCPRWRQFLDEVTAGDVAMQEYLQKVMGYALVGEVVDHILVFLYGTGRNGKGVFLNTLSAILGSYARTAPPNFLTEARNERHLAEIAMFQGVRFATAQEVNAGQAWDEQKIKMLTGGDRITARFMRQDPFEFVPQHTLIVAGNHKPKLHHVDPAIKGRLHMIPFTVNFEASGKMDVHLGDKLKAEQGGILQWMIDGCLAWQKSGLVRPSAVQAFTDEYLKGEDPTADWFEDCCEPDPKAFTPKAPLFDNFCEWCHRAGETAKPKKEFFQWIVDHGYREHKIGVRGFQRIRLKAKS